MNYLSYYPSESKKKARKKEGSLKKGAKKGSVQKSAKKKEIVILDGTWGAPYTSTNQWQYEKHFLAAEQF